VCDAVTARCAFSALVTAVSGRAPAAGGAGIFLTQEPAFAGFNFRLEDEQ